MAKFSADQVVIWSGILALVIYFGGALIGMMTTGDLPGIWRILSAPLSADQDAPDFDPKTSNGADITIVTAALSALLGANLLPGPTDKQPNLHTVYLPDAGTYTYLSIFFAALLALALLVYWGSRRAALYLVADWLIFWGAFGAVATVILAIAELDQFSNLNRGVFIAMLLLGLLLVVVARIRDTIIELQRLKPPALAPRTTTEVAPEPPPPAQAATHVRWQIK